MSLDSDQEPPPSCTLRIVSVTMLIICIFRSEPGFHSGAPDPFLVVLSVFFVHSDPYIVYLKIRSMVYRRRKKVEEDRCLVEEDFVSISLVGSGSCLSRIRALVQGLL